MTGKKFTAQIVLTQAVDPKQLEEMLKRILPGGTIVRVAAQ